MIKVVKKTQIRHTPSGDYYMVLCPYNGLVYPVKIPTDNDSCITLDENGVLRIELSKVVDS